MRTWSLGIISLSAISVGLFLLLCMISAGDADAEWHIQGHTVLEDDTLVLDEDIIVDSGGWLDLRGVTLVFNNSLPGEHILEVSDGGRLSMMVSDMARMCEIRPVDPNNSTQLSASWASGIHLDGLIMTDCGFFTQGTSGSFHAAIDIENTDNASIENATMSGPYSSVRLSGCRDAHVSGCSINSSRVRPIIIESTYRATVSGNSISSTFGVDIGASTGIAIVGNSILSTFECLSMYMSDNVVVRENELIVLGMYGCSIDQSKTVSIESTIVRGAGSGTMDSRGIRLDSASFITISGCHLENLSKGIEIYNIKTFSRPFNFIVGNTIMNCSTGIYIASGHNVLQDDTIEDSDIGVYITVGTAEGWSDAEPTGNLARRCWIRGNSVGIQCNGATGTILSDCRYEGNACDINASSSDIIETGGSHRTWQNWALNIEGGSYLANASSFAHGPTILNATSSARAVLSQSSATDVWMTAVERSDCDVGLFNTTHPRRYDLDGTSVLRVHWDIDVSIHPDSRPVAFLSGNITVRDSDSNIMNRTSQLFPDPIQRFTVLEFELRGMALDNRTPHELRAVVGGRYATVLEGITTYRRILILIDDLPPIIQHLSPAESELNTPKVTFSGMATDNSMAPVRIVFHLDGAVYWQGLDNWTLTIPLDDGRHEVMVMAQDAQNNSAALTRELIIDTTPPWLLIINPPTLDTYTREASLSIQGQVTDASNLTLDGKHIPWELDRFEVVVDLPRDGLYRFNVMASDRLGNMATILLNVTKDTVPPVVMLEDYPNLTRDQAFIVNGSTEDGTVSILLDGDPVDVSPTGTFSLRLILFEGPNVRKLYAKDRPGNFAVYNLSITLDTIAHISIVSPMNGTKFQVEGIEIVLQVEPSAKVRLGGEEWYVADTMGYARINATLAEYETHFKLETIDLAGNEGRSEIDILYTPPVQTGSEVNLMYIIIPIVIGLILIGIVIIAGKRKRRTE